MASERVVILQLDHADPPGRLGEWLVDAGSDVVVVDLAGGADVPDLDGVDGLVVLGGTMGNADDAAHPFLPGVRALLRDAVSREVPTLAICLGAQLLATANGGRVVVNPDGPELGAQLIAKRTAAADDPLFAPLPITPDVIQWHYDMISRLPAGAVQLASSPGCEQQAFRLGRLAWGVQFHLETTPDVVREWADADAQTLQDYDLDRIVARADAVHDDVAEVWQPFAQAFVGVVRDPSWQPPQAQPDPVAQARAALAAEAGAARGLAMLPMPQLRPDPPPSPSDG